jgi:hypothetical protein
MLQKRVARKICEPKRKEGTGYVWRKLHNEELHNLYFLSNTIRVCNEIKEHEMCGEMEHVWER